MALLITSYILFLIFLGAFIICAITGTRILEKKSDAIAAYLIGAISYGILTIIIYNLEPKAPIVINNTVETKSVRTISISGGNQLENKESTQEKSTKDSSSNDKNGKIIGDTDSKIYHVPGSTYYEKELKKTSNNEYFDTVEEAEKAGYRAPKN